MKISPTLTGDEEVKWQVGKSQMICAQLHRLSYRLS
jgi:hypothetical protein